MQSVVITILKIHMYLLLFSFALLFLELEQASAQAQHLYNSRLTSPEEPELWIQQWGSFTPLDFDPEAGHLLSHQGDLIVIRDVKTGLSLRTYHHSDPNALGVIDARFLKNDRLLIGGRHELAVLDRQNGRRIQSIEFPEAILSEVAVDREQSLVATSLADGKKGKIQIYELASGRLRKTIFSDHLQTSLAFSPDSRHLLSDNGRNSYEVTLWDVSTGKQLGQVQPPTEGSLLRFSEDGRKFLTAGQGEFWYTPRVTVWDTKTLTKQQVIPREARDAWFVEDAVHVVVPGGAVEIWPPDRHEDPAPPEEWRDGFGPREIHGVANNHWLLKRNFKSSKLEMVPTAKDQQAIPIAEVAVPGGLDAHFPLAFSNDGRWLITGGATSALNPCRSNIWNLSDGRIQCQLNDVQLAEFHPSGTEFVARQPYRIQVLNTLDGKVLRSLKYDNDRLGRVTAIQFINDGKQLLTAHGDWYDGDGGGLLLWDYVQGKPIREYDTKGKAVLYAKYFKSNGGHIFAISAPGDTGTADIDQLTVFDAATGKQLTTRLFPRNSLAVFAESLSTSRYHASFPIQSVPATTERTSQLLSTFDLSPKLELPLSCRSIQFSKDGQVIVCLNRRRKLDLRDAQTAEILESFESPFRPKSSILPILHPGGQILCGTLDDPWSVRGTHENTIGFQDLVTGEMLARLYVFTEPYSWLIVTHDGAINGSPAGLKHVTWRWPGTLKVFRDDQRTQSAVRPKHVASALTRSLPDNETLHDHLTNSIP